MLQLPGSEVIRHFNTEGIQTLLTPSPQKRWFHVSITHHTSEKLFSSHTNSEMQQLLCITNKMQSFTSTSIHYLRHVKIPRYHISPNEPAKHRTKLWNLNIFDWHHAHVESLDPVCGTCPSRDVINEVGVWSHGTVKPQNTVPQNTVPRNTVHPGIPCMFPFSQIFGETCDVWNIRKFVILKCKSMWYDTHFTHLYFCYGTTTERLACELVVVMTWDPNCTNVSHFFTLLWLVKVIGTSLHRYV